jgi:pimeloyl-ACP methyl ester carboxylesterase
VAAPESARATDLELVTPALRLAALRWRPGAPRRVLALHGWLDNAASFTGLAPHLADCDLVALDLPGHGRSDHRPPGVPYHFVDFVPDVLAAADALGWSRFALLGHSLGTGIGCFVAAVAPQRLAGLALIEGIGPLSGQPEEEPDRLADSIRQMAGHGRRPPRRYADLAAAAAARARVGDLSPQAAALLVERALRADGDELVWRSDPRLRYRSPSYLTEEQVRAFLARIACPTLLLTGADAHVAARPGFAERCRCVADLTHQVLPGGHHLHLDHPERVAAPLAAFLAGLPAGEQGG